VSAFRPLIGLFAAAALLIGAPVAGADTLSGLTATAPSGSLTNTAPASGSGSSSPAAASASSSKASATKLPYTGSDPRITLLIGVAALLAGAGLRLRTGDARDY
jgi:LPXTG-motif cell wall-anchored protein